MGRIRVYIAMSMDGFIAGEDDDLDWLDAASPETSETDAVTFTGFMADVGALLMGRRTYDVVRGFEGPWPYGDTPVLVATHRALDDAPDTVEGVSGSIDSVLDRALAAAAGRDVYVDGGRMIQQAVDSGRVDELIVTVVPTLLGAGVPLFGALSTGPLQFEFAEPRRYGSMVQLRLTPRR